MKAKVAVVLCVLLGPSTAQAFAQDLYGTAPVIGPTSEQAYTPVIPCRFVNGINANDRVTTAANTTTARYYRVRGSDSSDFVSQGAAASAPNGCGIPTSATAILVNLTVADPTGDGDLKADPSDVLTPSSTSALNYTFGGARGKNLANAVVAKLCDLNLSTCASGATPTSPTRDILVTFHAGDSAVGTFFLADVLGYFSPISSVAGLTCSTNQVLKWGGSGWTCGTDTDTNGGGTVTSVIAGSGLSGGTITSSGTVSVNFGGTGAAVTSARSDHSHTGTYLPAAVTSCAAGSSIRVVNTDGTVTCQSDTNSGGTVTGVIAGSGLSGGTISTSGTIAVATGGISSAMIANGAVGSAQVNTAQVQTRVSAACTSGSTIQSINSDGTVVCQVADVTTGASVLSRPNDTTLIAAGYTEDLSLGLDSWKVTNADTAPTGVFAHTAVWTGTHMIVWGGFFSGTYFDTGSRYELSTNSWAATSTSGAPAARSGHSAVWTGTRMIVWGGNNATTYFNTGGIYNPTDNTWVATSLVSPPNARTQHTAVWTGSKMIIWGGQSITLGTQDTGALFDPSAATQGTWAATATSSAPSARRLHTALWTGSKMIVWGGETANASTFTNTGGQYDPTANSGAGGWVLMNASAANLPSARVSHAAVWTGTRMIVWGGDTSGAGTSALATGARYNPTSDEWTTVSSTDVPSARSGPTAVWTGSKMIVWGGNTGAGGTVFNTGAYYDPTSDIWTGPTSTTNVPAARMEHSMIWTGSQAIVWGGRDLAGTTAFKTGGQLKVLSVYMKN